MMTIVHIPARWILLATIAVLPAAAAAQGTNRPPRVAVGAGVGPAFLFHGDFDFTPWAWDADLRVGLARHVLFEAAVGEWRHAATRLAERIPVATPPGTIGRLDQTTNRVQRTFQANVLMTGAFGRARLTGGGGVGVLQHDRQTKQVTGDCSPGVSCGSSESSFSNASGAAQAVGGVEVRLSDGLALHGQVRFIVPMTDPGGSDLRVTTGLRWGFGG